MKIRTIEVAGIMAGIYGMRLPLKSHDKSDSYINEGRDPDGELNGDDVYYLGENDYNLSMRLIKSGSEHRKHLRHMIVWAEIEAPIMWISELDTYHTVPAVHISTSTMHTLKKEKFSESTIEFDLMDEFGDEFNTYCKFGNKLLERFNKTGDFKYLRGAKQILGGGFKHTICMPFNYENLRNIYFQRKHHKLKEWHEFCEWIKTLPYSEFITGEDNNE